MKLINLTPHKLNIGFDTTTGHKTVMVEASGDVARCDEQRIGCGSLDDIPVTLATYGAVTGLPSPEPGVAYIVSGLVLAAVPDRPDVFAPGPAIRDDQGKIIGCVGLSCTPAYGRLAP